MTNTSQYDLGKDERARIVSDVLQALSPDVLSDPNLPQVVQRLVDDRLGLLGPGVL